MRPLACRARQGFTLVELLVVIFIIAILGSLLLVGVIRVLPKGPELATANDIGQLHLGITKFKVKYGIYPTSRIVLSADMSKLDADSLAYLAIMWPNLGWQDPAVTLDWAGTGARARVSRLFLQFKESDRSCLGHQGKL